MGFAHIAILVRVDHEDTLARHTDVESVEEPDELALGHDELAVGVADVGCQLGAAARRVDAHHRGPGHRTGAEPEAQLGDVLEQEPDVERSRPPHRRRERGARRRRTCMLVPRPVCVLEEQRRTRVAAAPPDHLVDRVVFLRGHALSTLGNVTLVYCQRHSRNPEQDGREQ